jgi:hypothetical protein
MTLTELDMAKLSYPFPRSQYEFLEGYVYIQEEAISERLDKVDPNWSIAIDETIAYGDSIVVRSTLTVKGVSRSNSGGNPVQREKKDKTILGQYAVADNGVNAYKSAATDAFKRCARMFGIGRALLSAPKEGGAFDKWLEQEHTMAKARLDALRKVDAETGEVILLASAPPPLTVKAGATVTERDPLAWVDEAAPGAKVTVLPTLDMKALYNRAMKAKIGVKNYAHLENLYELLADTRVITLQSTEDEVFEAMKAHEAQKEAVS